MPKQTLLVDQQILERINRASLRFLSPLDINEVYSAVVQEAIGLVSAEYGSIFLLEKDKLVRVFASLDLLYQIRPKKEGPIYNALVNQTPTVIKVKNYPEMHDEIKKMGIKSIIVIPLSYRKKSIGVLSVESTKEETLTDKELGILSLFSSTITLAIIKTRLYQEAKDALENRDLFISLAAHELRTPLTTMFVYINLLREKAKTSKNKTTYRLTRELSAEASRLEGIINELLTLSRVKTGKMTFVFKEANLPQIVERARINFNSNHPGYKLKVLNKLKSQDVLICDSDKLIQVLTNILDNAAKFSPKGKVIVLEIGTKGRMFEIKIKDQGAGLTKEEIPKVFQGFYKAHGNYKQGMGLGLFLAKNIIDKHKGLINLTSEIGEGTTVQILLPIS